MSGFLAANWLWIVLVVGMLAMHRRGGCGMHGHDHSSHGRTHEQDGHGEHVHDDTESPDRRDAWR